MRRPDLFLRHALFIVMMGIGLAFSHNALAQQQPAAQAQTAPVSGTIVAEQQKILKDLSQRTDELDKRIAANSRDDAKLVAIRLELEEIATELLKSGVAFRPRISEINGRLEQLGAAPAEGQPVESEIVANERASLIAEKAEINALIGVAEDLSIRVRSLIGRIATLRSDLFQSRFTERVDLFDAFGNESITDANVETAKFYRLVSTWFRFVIQSKFQAILIAASLALSAALVLLVGGRRLFGNLLEPDPTEEHPSYLSRLSVTFWSTLLPTAALAVFLSATAFFLDYYNILRGDIGAFLLAFSTGVVIVFYVNRLSRAALSPALPNWRLIPVETRPAVWLVRLLTAMAVVLAWNYFLSAVSEQMDSPLSITIVRSFANAMVISLILALIGMVRPFRDKQGDRRPWPPLMRYALFAFSICIVLAALLGYIRLAMFIAEQVVITGTILLTAYIGFLSSRAIGEEGGFAATIFGRQLAEHAGFSEATLDQLSLVVSTAVNLLIVAIFLPLTLFMWGFQPGDLQAWAYRIATGVQIGSISISLTGILTGLAVFIVGYFLTRWFQSWLDGSVMARGRVDLGVRNSIRTVVGYAGLALAALVSISAAGINLSSLALVAGGLSLGIGFGLQNIVSNFVSGLILLAERPFKAGDWIVAGTVSGTVKKISVRATEIETFQRQTMIMPNSLLINAQVGNWTLRNKLGRVDITLNLAYGTDVAKANQIMLEIARSCPLVLKNPEPFVLFSNFGLDALEFEVRVFLADITNGALVQNDIRFRLVDAFAAAGIQFKASPPPAEAEPEAEAEPALVAVASPAPEAKAEENPKPARTSKRKTQ